MTLPPFHPPQRPKNTQAARGDTDSAIPAIPAAPATKAAPPETRIAGIADSGSKPDAGLPRRPSQPSLFDPVVPQAWLSALLRVEADRLVDWGDVSAGRRRQALLRGFAVSHGTALQSMGWGFWDVFGRLLDQRCVFAWRGDALVLIDRLVDRLVLQADAHRFTVRKEKYRDPKILRRTTRAADPPELTLDDTLLRKGRGNADFHRVMVALMLSEPKSVDELQRMAPLDFRQLKRVLSDLRRHGLIANAGLEITEVGWQQIARFMPEHANLAKARLNGYDDDIPF